MKARLEEDSDTWQYRFPWEKVNAGKSIVIYGAGKVGHAFYTQMMRTKYCEVLYFVDREKTSIEENKARVIGLSELADVYVGEQIVVAIGDATIRKKAAEELSSTININQNLIIYNYKI
jgi:FlaA1/EpsC-like NDP-sugar epimerase